MSALLRLLGLDWTILGAANIFLMPWATASQGLLSIGLVVNLMLFLLPGLGLYGLGTMMDRKA